MEKNSGMENLIQELRDNLENNILSFWLRLQDPERGGFFGQVTGEGELRRDANRGAILNARILWAFSAAYRVLGNPEYLAAATNAKDYILAHFIDREYGGCFWELDCNGNPIDTKKQFYAIGFMIYGLSEYARALNERPAPSQPSAPTSSQPSAAASLPCSAAPSPSSQRPVLGDSVAEQAEEALSEALALFHCIEEHAWDKTHGGYIEALTRDWQPIADMRLSALDANFPKSQNTHLHIIEPYTNLYRALKSSRPSSPSRRPVPGDSIARLKSALESLLSIFTDRILNPETHHLDLFFEMDWTRGAGHLESYGHDIECSWLMHETALVLADKDILNKVEPIVQLVAKASEKGLNADGSMTHEANLDTGHIDDDRHWWVQAEAVVGFFNIYQHFGDQSALQKALNCWQYIKENLIDHEQGEWFWSRDREGKINRSDDKAGFWKCPYHNSRMCLELIERMESM